MVLGSKRPRQQMALVTRPRTFQNNRDRFGFSALPRTCVAKPYIVRPPVLGQSHTIQTCIILLGTMYHWCPGPSQSRIFDRVDGSSLPLHGKLTRKSMHVALLWIDGSFDDKARAAQNKKDRT